MVVISLVGHFLKFTNKFRALLPKLVLKFWTYPPLKGPGGKWEAWVLLGAASRPSQVRALCHQLGLAAQHRRRGWRGLTALPGSPTLHSPRPCTLEALATLPCSTAQAALTARPHGTAVVVCLSLRCTGSRPPCTSRSPPNSGKLARSFSVQRS